VTRARWAAALVLPLISIWLPPLTAQGADALTGIRIDNPVPAANANFGFAVAGLGDLDGDGSEDLAVGAPRQGAVYLISGSTHSLLRSISDPDNLAGTQCEPTADEPSPCDFGLAVASAGDVNGDGVEDVAVGAPGIFGGAVAVPCVDPSQPCPQDGRAFIFSGRTGQLILRLAHDGPNQGAAIADLGSIDGDLIPDFAVVAPGSTSKGGLVAAFAGSDGHEIWTTFAPPATQGITGLAFTGSALAALPDVNGDGHDDLLVGAPEFSPGPDFFVGRAYVLSGATGEVLRTYDNPSPLAFDAFGVGVAAVGDQDGDGKADYAISEPGGSQSAGSVIHLYSGATGSELGVPITSPADERNGATSSHLTMALAAVGDTNADGKPDFWLGATTAGAAYLIDRDGQVLETAADSQPGSGFGLALSPIAASAGEPGSDVIAGAPMRSAGGFDGAGAVFLLRSQADLQLSKTATPSTVIPGGKLTYSVSLFNAGPSLASGVEVTDPIEPPSTLVPASLVDDTACSFDATTSVIRCDVGSLPAGSTFNFEFDVVVADDVDVPSTVVNSATATAVTLDPVPGNNTASTSTPLACDIVGTSGNDVLVATAAGESVCGLGGDDVLIGKAGNDLLIGGAGDDTLIAQAGDDTLVGGSGNDRLFGQGGNDRLFGGTGDDRLYGGPGTDLLDGGPGFDVCKASPGGGTVTNCESA